ncbi:hypothetical protein BC332_33139 [Capsicum chinense]|nr:hypothetical protein BC332_33139 [Capsicum chinense]
MGGFINGDKMKHILPKLFYIHELQKNDDINVQQIRSTDNVTDLFTKSSPIATFKKILHKIEMERTPAPHAAKVVGMKTPVFKSIQPQQPTSSKGKKLKQITRIIFPLIQSKSESPVDVEAVSKPNSPVEKEAFISKNVFDSFLDAVHQEFKAIHTLGRKKFKMMFKAIEQSKQQYEDEDSEPQHMDYDSVETSPQRFNPNDENEDGTKTSDDKVDEINLRNSQFTISDELLRSLHAYRRESITTPPSTIREEPTEQSTDEQRNKLVCPDSQSAILDELFSSLNADNSKSIIVHPSRELQIPVQKLRIRKPFKFKKSPYTMKFDSAIERSSGHIRIFPKKYPFVYHPNDGIVDMKIVNKFMDWISEDFLKVYAKRSIYDVYSMDDSNLTAGGQVAHLNEYISGFRMHVVVPWNIVEDIYIPVNIKEKHHYVLAVLSFSERYIFLYDSYESSGHYPAVFAQIKKLAEIIPLCLQTCDFYSKKGIDLQNYPRYKDKDYSYLFNVIFEENFPQQPSESLGCGVFMVTYAECLSYGHKVFATEFDLNGLRTRYVVLWWDYGIRNKK